MTFSIIQILAVFGRLGLDTAMLKFSSELFASKKLPILKDLYFKSLNGIIISSLILTGLIVLSSDFISEYIFHKNYLSLHIKILALGIVPLNITYLNSECFRGIKKAVYYSFFKTVSAFLFAVPIVFFMSGSILNTYYIDIIFVISLIITMVISLVFWNKTIGYKNITRGNGMSFKSMMVIAKPMLLSSSLVFLLDWTASIALGIYRPDSEVGIYHVALKLSSLTMLASTAVNTITAPKFAEYHSKNDMQGLKNTVRHSNYLTFWTTIPVLLLYGFFPEFVLGFFGEEFKIGALALLFISIGYFINSISGSVGNLLLMTGLQKQANYVVLLGTIVNIAANFALVPYFGITGAGIASMLGVATWNLVAVIIVKQKLGFSTIYFPNFLKVSGKNR